MSASRGQSRRTGRRDAALGPVGAAGAEVDAAEPAVGAWPGGVASEDGGAGRRELVLPVGVGDEQCEMSARATSGASPIQGGSSEAVAAREEVGRGQ